MSVKNTNIALHVFSISYDILIRWCNIEYTLGSILYIEGLVDGCFRSVSKSFCLISAKALILLLFPYGQCFYIYIPEQIYQTADRVLWCVKTTQYICQTIPFMSLSKLEALYLFPSFVPYFPAGISTASLFLSADAVMWYLENSGLWPN